MKSSILWIMFSLSKKKEPTISRLPLEGRIFEYIFSYRKEKLHPIVVSIIQPKAEKRKNITSTKRK